MKIKIIKVGFSWQIIINGKHLATVWMVHGTTKEEQIELVNKFLMGLNTESEEVDFDFDNQ